MRRPEDITSISILSQWLGGGVKDILRNLGIKYRILWRTESSATIFFGDACNALTHFKLLENLYIDCGGLFDIVHTKLMENKVRLKFDDLAKIVSGWSRPVFVVADMLGIKAA